jgi:hypothetical protein
MAKNTAYTSKYDNKGKPEDDDEPVAATTEAPPPGTAPHGVPVGLPPEDYYTSQEAHVADGGEYAPPPESEEELTARRAKEAKEAEDRRAKEAKALDDEAKSKKAKKED